MKFMHSFQYLRAIFHTKQKNSPKLSSPFPPHPLGKVSRTLKGLPCHSRCSIPLSKCVIALFFMQIYQKTISKPPFVLFTIPGYAYAQAFPYHKWYNVFSVPWQWDARSTMKLMRSYLSHSDSNIICNLAWLDTIFQQQIHNNLFH